MAENESGPLLDLADQLTELKLNEVRDLFAAENIDTSPSNRLTAHLRIQTNDPTKQTRLEADNQNKVVTGRPETISEISGQVKQQQQQDSGDAHKIKLIQQQMVLLLHTHRCRQLDNKIQCNLHLCLKLKPVLEHVVNCTLGNDCSFPQCKSLRKLISHWRLCLSTECPVCWPLKLVDQNRRIQQIQFQRSQSV